MQFLTIPATLTLVQLANRIGSRNVDSVLGVNSLTRTPLIGQAFGKMCASCIANAHIVPPQRIATLLNPLSISADVFEHACLMGEAGWKILSNLGTFPNMLKLPESVKLPDAVDILGNGSPVAKDTYEKVMDQLKNPPHKIDPSIFNEYSTMKPTQISSNTATPSSPFQWFKLPWGDISLHSSLSGDSVDFPVYPEDVDDEVSAAYTTMPDLLYQYEPWQVYTGSGPRQNTYTFKMHRDMWTGDHRDNKCNELIRFCEANCYPEYNGSSVNTSTVSLYVKGNLLISGVMTNCAVSWDGPIGLDGWYLNCKLQLTIVEVSNTPLNYSTIRSKGVIG